MSCGYYCAALCCCVLCLDWLALRSLALLFISLFCFYRPLSRLHAKRCRSRVSIWTAANTWPGCCSSLLATATRGRLICVLCCYAVKEALQPTLPVLLLLLARLKSVFLVLFKKNNNNTIVLLTSFPNFSMFPNYVFDAVPPLFCITVMLFYHITDSSSADSQPRCVFIIGRPPPRVISSFFPPLLTADCSPR